MSTPSPPAVPASPLAALPVTASDLSASYGGEEFVCLLRDTACSEQTSSSQELMGLADKQLYRAKHTGKSRVSPG